MSMWQFATTIEGWMKANGNLDEEGAGSGMSDRQADEIWEWLQNKQDVPLTGMRH